MRRCSSAERAWIAAVAALGFAAVPAAALAHDHGHGGVAAVAQQHAAIGQPGLATRVGRTIAVDMSDGMRFTPARVEVRQGETVRFVIRNSGRLQHEFILDSAKGLRAHHEHMKKHPEMEPAEPNMLTLAPGKSGEIVWQFSQAGQVDFACLQPEHYEAGMKGAVEVTPGASRAALAGTR
ncbi:MAG TPA: cupredoxin family protein [Variovorax sp.]|nr:cupredoxin family protein [Variovorax sp.]